MNDVIITPLTDWNLVLNLARATVSKGNTDKEPSAKFKDEMLRSEHSPLRALMFRIDLIGVPYWVSVHFVRHKVGVEHFVSTQRSDRTGEYRDGKRQDAPVNHTMIINAQELLVISRRRLCGKASKETREWWLRVIMKLRSVDSFVAGHCVPMCCYRGGVCPEAESCGRAHSEKLVQM